MRKLAFLIVLGGAFSAACAQDSTRAASRAEADYRNGVGRTFLYSIGPDLSFPIGGFHSHSGFGLGASAQGEYKPGARVGVTLNAGYLIYFGNTVDKVMYPDFKYVPVLAGVKLYLCHSFYVHAQAGPGFGMDGLGTSFWYGGGPGFNFGRGLEAEVKYLGWKQSDVYSDVGGTTGPNYGGHYSVIGFRLAYIF
jgi:hypothetical protein